jgi:hypothetical protein
MALVGSFSQIERGEACSMSATIATEFCVAEKFRYVPKPMSFGDLVRLELETVSPASGFEGPHLAPRLDWSIHRSGDDIIECFQ